MSSNLTDFFSKPDAHSVIGEMRLFDHKRGISFVDNLGQTWLRSGVLSTDTTSYPLAPKRSMFVSNTDEQIKITDTYSQRKFSYYDRDLKVVYGYHSASSYTYRRLTTHNLNDEYAGNDTGSDYEVDVPGWATNDKLCAVVPCVDKTRAFCWIINGANAYWHVPLMSTSTITSSAYKTPNGALQINVQDSGYDSSKWDYTRVQGSHMDSTHGKGLMTFHGANTTDSYKVGVRYCSDVTDGGAFSPSSPVFTDVEWNDEASFADVTYIRAMTASDDTLYVIYQAPSVPNGYSCREIPLSGDLTWASGTDNHDLGSAYVDEAQFSDVSVDTGRTYNAAMLYYDTVDGEPRFLKYNNQYYWQIFKASDVIGFSLTASTNTTNVSYPFYFQRIA